MRVDRRLAWYRSNSVRYLVVDIRLEKLPEAQKTPKEPLNLALVIDRSGSMRGDPLRAARWAATQVVETLSKKDRLSVVCFNHGASTILNSRAMDKEGRTEAIKAIETIPAGGKISRQDGCWVLNALHKICNGWICHATMLFFYQMELHGDVTIGERKVSSSIN